MKTNKLLIVILLALSSCLTYQERDIRHQARDTYLDNVLAETEVQRARRILDRRSSFVKHYMRYEVQNPFTDVWIRRPEILEKTVGDCDDAMFDLGDYALANGVNPELFRYCIVRKPDASTFWKYKYHAVLLFYGDVYNGEIVTTTGIISERSIVSLEDCYDMTGYYPYVSWHVVDGEWVKKDGELFYIGELKIYKHKPIN